HKLVPLGCKSHPDRVDRAFPFRIQRGHLSIATGSRWSFRTPTGSTIVSTGSPSSLEDPPQSPKSPLTELLPFEIITNSTLFFLSRICPAGVCLGVGGGGGGRDVPPALPAPGLGQTNSHPKSCISNARSISSSGVRPGVVPASRGPHKPRHSVSKPPPYLVL